MRGKIIPGKSSNRSDGSLAPLDVDRIIIFEDDAGPLPEGEGGGRLDVRLPFQRVVLGIGGGEVREKKLRR